jgi:mannose-6-phosphate isomerase-like protein (cupin superfamily)
MVRGSRSSWSTTSPVRAGPAQASLKARITADGEDIEAGPGDIAVVGPDTPHKFKNMGTDRLDIICIHSSPRLIQEALE